MAALLPQGVAVTSVANSKARCGRGGRIIGPTTAGEQLLGYARRMLALNDEIFGRLTAQQYDLAAVFIWDMGAGDYVPHLLREGGGRCRKRGQNRRLCATGFACGHENVVKTYIYQTVKRKSNSWPRVQQLRIQVAIVDLLRLQLV